MNDNDSVARIPHLFLRPCDAPPFERYPFLNAIWPEPYASEAARASNADWRDEDEPVFLICYDDPYNVIGVTGIFILREHEGPVKPNDVHLRWTGVVPNMRRKGFTTRAVSKIVSYCMDNLPQYKRLIELAPDNEYGRTVPAPFFETIGFVNEGPIVCWDEPQIQYVYDLSKPLRCSKFETTRG